MGRLAAALLYGPVPVEDALQRCDELRERGRGDRRVEAGVLAAEAELEAMLGSFDGTRVHTFVQRPPDFTQSPWTRTVSPGWARSSAS